MAEKGEVQSLGNGATPVEGGKAAAETARGAEQGQGQEEWSSIDMTKASSFVEPEPSRRSMDESRKFAGVAPRGCSLLEGPHIRFSLRWYGTVEGLEFFHLYLWLLKDWSWSQLRWMTTGMLAGSLALFWCLMLMGIAFRHRLYSELYMNFGMLLWLLANYAWMIAEFWNLNVIEDRERGEELEQKGWNMAKIFSSLASWWFAVYFLLLQPCDMFSGDRLKPRMIEITGNCPPRRFRWLFRTFRDYESLHLLFWALKDCMWAWSLRYGYLIFFIPTVFLNLDLLYLFATHRQQWIDFWHYLVLLFWVVANGIWATGELFEENPNDSLIDFSDWANYSWPRVPENELFIFRYAAGWVFFVCVMILVLFYIMWWVHTCWFLCHATHTTMEHWDSQVPGNEAKPPAATNNKVDTNLDEFDLDFDENKVNASSLVRI